MDVDAGGSTALLVSERPVLISGRPVDMKESLNMMLNDSCLSSQPGAPVQVIGLGAGAKSQSRRPIGQLGIRTTGQLAGHFTLQLPAVAASKPRFSKAVK